METVLRQLGGRFSKQAKVLAQSHLRGSLLQLHYTQVHPFYKFNLISSLNTLFP